MTEEHKLVAFLGNDDYIIEVDNGSGREEARVSYNLPIASILELLKKSDYYRVVKSFDVYDLGL